MRISDWSSDVCSSDLWVICADEGLRGGRTIPLKANVDKALEKVDVKAVLVIAHTGGDVAMQEGRDHWYDALSADVDTDCPCEPRSEEHTSELQSLMRNSYAVFCLKKKNTTTLS